MPYDVNDRACRLLSKAGLKITQQRKTILDIILASDVRLTAADIYAELSAKSCSFGIATIYRTLALLEENGIIKKTEMPGDDSGFYSACDGHKHCFVCTRCKREFKIDFCPIDARSEELSRKMNFTVTGHSFEIFGICADCAAKSAL